MVTSILVYNTGRFESKLMTEVFSRLRSEHCYFKIMSHHHSSYEYSRPWLLMGQGIMGLMLPVWYVLYLGTFLLRNLFLKTRIVICFHWPEKIIISPVARLCGWRVLWLELPDAEKPRGFMMKKIYERQARGVEVIVFSQEKAHVWEKTVGKAGKVYIMNPALYPPRSSRQIDLFETLVDRPHRRFSIGALIEHLDRKLIERLLSGLTSALSVSSNFELLIMGEGENRKELLWLIRKMGLGNHVWLAGQTDDITRHLDHLDLYVIPTVHPSLEEIGSAIMVLQHGIPIIGQIGSGLEAITYSEFGSVVEMNDSEALGAEFLRFEQLGSLKHKIIRQAREHAHVYTIETLSAALKNILVTNTSR